MSTMELCVEAMPESDFIAVQQNMVYWYAFYLQVKDDVQKDMDTLLGDDKHESSVTSDSVRVSLRLQSNPVPKSLTQSHTSTDNTSTMGRCSC